MLTGYAAGWDQMGADPNPAGSPEERADRLLAWLAGTDKRWLLVLDDLVDPVDLCGLWPTGTHLRCPPLLPDQAGCLRRSVKAASRRCAVASGQP